MFTLKVLVPLIWVIVGIVYVFVGYEVTMAELLIIIAITQLITIFSLSETTNEKEGVVWV